MILAFVLIKFIVYPGLGFVLATTHPVVAVVSGSMEHDGSFDDWWESKAICSGIPCSQREFYATLGITQEKFVTFPFRNGFNTGDIMILKGKPIDKIEIGDVIVFQGGKRDPVIHRIVASKYIDGEYSFQTKGDHNPRSIGSGSLTEIDIRENQIIGNALFRIPYLGWIKIIFTKIVQLVL